MEIKISGVTRNYGATPALRGIDLDIRSGELMALLGPSGSGKTTLLRVIAGLEAADRGNVLFGGQDATSLPVQKRNVGFVFQHYALFRHLSVFDNIAYGLRCRPRSLRPSAKDIRGRVLKLLELVQLEGLEKRFPTQLSGGQRQRVALARALAVEPDVLLLDEPFGALDAKVRKDLRRWLREIHERTGQTTIFVTHDQDEAIELADRVAILNKGLLEQVGTPDEVYDDPETAFVMSFIGETAKIKAEVHEGAVWVNGGKVPISPPDTLTGDVELYIRPWDLRPVGLDEPAHLEGIIRSSRRVGNVRRAQVSLDDNNAVEIDLPLWSTIEIGAPVNLAVTRARFFEK
ncbi:sulfate ABC transporter ATP-binding protein [Microvirga sp. W0021]|uniref:Sulfate ABC transporter ATP-binding protein n=1 Tax=Hohaiivirga grylli TaxID=3133970 RepID=A0ABV0BIT3_9HYPH